MTNAVIGALRVMLGIDTAEFERDTGKAKKHAKTFEKDVQGSFEKGIAAIQNGLKGLAAGLIAGFAAAGLEGVYSAVRDVARGVAEVGDQARRAGVDVESFQELAYVAQQNRIGVDALTDGLKEMNLRADEFVLTGQGSGAEAFQRLGFGADELKKKLEDPSALFSEIIGRLQQLDAAAQIRIADEIFGGTGGEQFVQLLKDGEAGVRDLIEEANSLGIVMDENLIKRATELDRRFNAIAQTVGTALKSAIVSAADSLSEFIDGFRDYQNQLSSTLENRQAELGMQRLEIENKILAAREQQNELARAGMLNPLSQGVANVDLSQYQRQLQEIAAEEARIVDARNKRIKPMERSADRTWEAPTPTGAVVPQKSKGGTSDAERQAKAYERVTQSLRDELSLVGQSETAQRILNAQRSAGVTATSAQGQAIAGLVTQIDAQNAAMSQAQRAGQFFADTLTNAFEGLIDGSKSLKDSLRDLLKQLASMWVNNAFEALFMGAAGAGGAASGAGGFLSTLFKLLPGFAQGGSIMPGGGGLLSGVDSQVVAFRKKPSEQVDIYEPGRKSRGGGGVADVRVYVDQDGNWQAAVQRISDERVSNAAPAIVGQANSMVMPTMARFQSQKAGGDYRNG